MPKNKKAKQEEEITISEFVKSIGNGLKLPENFDYKKDRLEYLEQKHK